MSLSPIGIEPMSRDYEPRDLPLIYDDYFLLISQTLTFTVTAHTVLASKESRPEVSFARTLVSPLLEGSFYC